MGTQSCGYFLGVDPKDARVNIQLGASVDTRPMSQSAYHDRCARVIAGIIIVQNADRGVLAQVYTSFLRGLITWNPLGVAHSSPLSSFRPCTGREPGAYLAFVLGPRCLSVWNSSRSSLIPSASLALLVSPKCRKLRSFSQSAIETSGLRSDQDAFGTPSLNGLGCRA